MYELELPLPPGTNRIWRVYHGITVLSKEARDFKQKVFMLAKERHLDEPTEDNVVVNILYAPKARKKETNRPMRRMDVDAVIKPVLDSLIGIAYVDDKQVIDVRSRIVDPIEGGRIIVMWRAA